MTITGGGKRRAWGFQVSQPQTVGSSANDFTFLWVCFPIGYMGGGGGDDDNAVLVSRLN